MANLRWGYTNPAEAFFQFRLRQDTELPKEMLTTMSNLASCYYWTQQFEKALPIQEDLLEAYQSKYGPDDPETLTRMNNLAAMYAQVNRRDRSTPLFEEALKRRTKILGRKNKDTLATAASLGVDYLETGRIKDAIKLLQEAYDFSSKEPTLQWVGDYLVDAYMKDGQTPNAVKLIEKLLAEARKDPAIDRKELMMRLKDFGKELLKIKEFAKAEDLFRQSYDIGKKEFPDAWETFYIQSLLGRALLAQKNYAAAEPLLKQGYDGMKAREKLIPPLGKALIPATLDDLIELYGLEGKIDEKKKYEEYRAKYPPPKPTP